MINLIPKRHRFRNKVLFFLIICALLAGGYYYLKGKIQPKQPVKQPVKQIEEPTKLEDIDFSVETVDANEYFENNSKVISQINVQDSTEVKEEREIEDVLKERGFTGYPVTYDYSMDGTFLNDSAVSNQSSQKHPIYQTYYVTQKEELWNIMVIDGDFFANPVSHNLESEDNVKLILSESEEVTSYDSRTNKFYRTVPNEDVLNVKVVERIDAKTLESIVF